MSDSDTITIDAEISKRKLLGALGTIGGATALGGVGTIALLSDQELFGNADNPNTIQAGQIDLTVDWKVVYFGVGGSPQTIASQNTPVDRPGPIVDVTDLKPGDVIEKTLSTHIDGNPAFLTFEMSVFADEDNGITNPEDAVDNSFDGTDGTPGGDLAEHLNCVVWYDGFEDSEGNSGGAGATPGNNRPDEGIWTASGDPTNDTDFEAGLDSAQSPADAFDTSSDRVVASGTLADLAGTSDPILLDSRDQGVTPDEFSGSACYDSGGVQYIGCVCWLPRDIPGVEDNIIQTDRLEYQFGFGAIQCRDNVADDGTPISTDVADQPGGGDGGDGDGDGDGDGEGPSTFPETQLFKLFDDRPDNNPNLDVADRFAESVALAGDTAIVGAPGDEFDLITPNIGSAFVFTRSGGNWSQEPEVIFRGQNQDDRFGKGVELDGDTALVWAPYVGSNNTPTVYVFMRSGGSWSQQDKLTPGDISGSMALDGDTALLGAPTTGSSGGSVYVYTRSGSSWSQQTTLTAQNADSGDAFGSAVALDGDTALIGASGDEDPNGASAGSAYVFTRSGGSWSQQDKLAAQDTTADADDEFGGAVALDGDTALIGASGDEDPHGNNAGSAYVFTRSGGSWSQQDKLTAQDPTAEVDDLFGVSVSLDGDIALVGASGDEDPNGTSAGSAYVFTRSGGSWSQQTKLFGQDRSAGADDEFGFSVSLNGATALIGAPGNTDPSATGPGSAYVFGP